MPDLNSVPASPHVLARRASSQRMPPPPVPTSPSLNILPSNQSAVQNAGAASPHPSPGLPPTGAMIGPVTDNSGVGPGPGPLRHPRPMTAVDLHLQLEKEQEAVVNRLTRELSILRAAQNSSVVSNASSTSASMSGTETTAAVGDTPHLGAGAGAGAGAGFSHPLHGRHHRTSSNASTRSLTANTGSLAATSLTGISAPAPVRPGGQPLGGISLSRQSSAASRLSRTGSPVLAAVTSAPAYPPLSSSQHGSQAQTPLHNNPQNTNLSEYFAQRTISSVVPSDAGTSMQVATPGSEQLLSPGLLPGTIRYVETAFYRAELENVKRENEALKRRVRELERMLRQRRASDASQVGGPSSSSSQSHSQSQDQGPVQGQSLSQQSSSGNTAGGNNSGGAMHRRSESSSTTASMSAHTAAGGVSIAAPREPRDRPRMPTMVSSVSSVGVGVPDEEVRVGESAASTGLALAQRTSH